LESHRDAVDTVCVTLDSHHAMHIANVTFWEDSAGAQPDAFTVITAADVREGKWRARQWDPRVRKGPDRDAKRGAASSRICRRPELRAEALHYVEQLENCGGKFQLITWPEHCLVGSPGHAVVRCTRAPCRRPARLV
jgi:nicotinamidase-related amidase